MAAKPPRWVYWLAAILWLPVGSLVGYAVGHNARPASAQFEPAGPAAVPEKAFPGVRINYVGSGKFQVPSQVTPGTYIVAASGLNFGCSWELRKADDSKPKSVIAEGSVNRGEFGQFTVVRTARVLKLLGDCMWSVS